MKERPILFSAPMVRALLNCTKSQTRRVVKLTEAGHIKEPCGHRRWHPSDTNASLACQYGQPGDRLWVKETHWRDDEDGSILYAANPDDMAHVDLNKHESGLAKYNWKPSIFMRRGYSRILLEIVSIRIERLQDISEADALSEGVTVTPCKQSQDERMGRHAFRSLWEDINGNTPAEWAANPLVWVVEFNPVTPGTTK